MPSNYLPFMHPAFDKLPSLTRVRLVLIKVKSMYPRAVQTLPRPIDAHLEQTSGMQFEPDDIMPH